MIAFISNLIKSVGEQEESGDLEYDWLENYWKGSGFEIYRVPLNKVFGGLTFSNSAQKIYKRFGAILFGIEIIVDEQPKILLNPGDFIMPITSQKQKVNGYIIAEDKETADEISKYSDY